MCDRVWYPHDGAALVMQALMAGQVDYMCDQLMDAVPAARTKRVKAYAVSSPERSPTLQDVPTTSEAGLPNYEVITWIALFGPAGVPKAIQDRLNRAVSMALNDDSVRQQLVASGGDIPDPQQRTPQSLSELVKEDIGHPPFLTANAKKIPKAHDGVQKIATAVRTSVF